MQSPDLHKLRSWHQYNSVELDMILFSARTVELSVQYDDDKWHLLNSIRVFPSFCMSPKIPLDSFVVFCFFRSKLFPIAMRFSAEILFLLWIPVSVWVLGISSFFLIILLNHLLQEIQVLHFFGLSRLLSHSVFWNSFDDAKFSKSSTSVIRSIFFPSFTLR